MRALTAIWFPTALPPCRRNTCRASTRSAASWKTRSASDAAQLVDVARCGINKINVDTDIRLACTRNLLELFEKEPELRESASIGQLYKDLKKNPKNFDPRNYVASIMDTITLGVVPDAHVQKVVDCMKDGVTESIAPLLVQFGSYRKSHLIEVVTCEQMAERYKKAGI